MNVHQLALLLKVRLQILLNSLRRGSGKKRTRSWLALLGGGVLCWFIFRWTFEMFSSLQTVTAPGSSLIDNFLMFALLGFFLFIFVSGSTVTIHYLFIASDLPLLMTSPISSRTIFASKLIEAMFANSSFFLLMGISVCIAFGVINSAQWYYYLMLIVIAVLFLAVPIGLAFLVALLIVKIISPNRARDLLGIILGITSLLFWLALQLVRASSFDRNSPDFNPAAVKTLEQASHYAAFNLLPSSLASRSLIGLANADFQSFILNLSLLTLIAACLIFLCIQLSQHVFREGFITGATTVKSKKKVLSSPLSTASAQERRALLSGVISAVLIRDLRLLFRDTRHFISIAMLGAMMVIISLLQQHRETDSEIALYSTYIFILLFSGILAGHISSRLIPIEGRSFWITRLAPQPSLKIILGKFFLAWLLSTGITWTALIFLGVYTHQTGQLFRAALLLTSCITAACCSLGLYISSHSARFDWDHPKRMLGAAGGLFLSIAPIGLIALVVAVYALGVQLQLSSDLLLWGVVSITLLVCSVIVVLAQLGAAKKIHKMEWEY